MHPDPEVDLTTCDREQLHLLGGVQPHGFFLAFRSKDRTIYHVSTNIREHLGHNPEDLIGRRMDDALPAALVNGLLRIASTLDADAAEVLKVDDLGRRPLRYDGYEGYAYELNGLIAVEFEPIVGDPSVDPVVTAAAVRRCVTRFTEDLQSTKAPVEAAKLACRAIRNLTEFDRVMMYRYLPTWDGEVIAEDKSAEAHTFLNHRFPASDIPLPARQMYFNNRTRLIVDSAAPGVGIEPSLHYLTNAPIDLTRSKLRAVSPIHLQYLANMGVGASFSVAVIVGNRLWGLVACHANKSKGLSHDVRRACGAVAGTFATVVAVMEDLLQKNRRIQFDADSRRIFRSVINSVDPIQSLIDNHVSVENVFSAGGIGLASTRRTQIAGLTPTRDQTRALANELRSHFKMSSTTVLAIDCLAKANPEWAVFADLACGVLAVFSPEFEESVLMIFRPEHLRTVVWGGDPRKTMDRRGYEGTINPRRSFDSWSETVRMHSAPWETFEVEGAQFADDFVFGGLAGRDALIRELGAKLKITGKDL